MKLYKIASTALVCAVVATAVAGCSSSESPSAKGTSGSPGGSAATSTKAGTSAGAGGGGEGSGGAGAEVGGAASGKGKSGAGGSAKQGEGASKPRAYVDKAPNYAKVSPSAPTKSGVVDISYHDYAIQPDTVKVKVGTTIKWTNHDPAPHNVKSEGGPIKFASSEFGQGKSFEVKMTKPGVVHYECTLEPTTMNGTIEVVE